MVGNEYFPPVVVELNVEGIHQNGVQRAGVGIRTNFLALSDRRPSRGQKFWLVRRGDEKVHFAITHTYFCV